ncbi:hypothetical protein MMF93_14175 [Streptomyces tubbatahanensis]|uniref:Secreted protein n=1 Tax=Streptomyces tubbatahanensis TaxID=2923272 RepID=A0ABY3XT12_9ACTN|nr:hypothetical protein [Streptomyces tubbatahanensis]UNS97509.1 hypothetical protein MMF93_14175 [Streptomyces tubbatahanensis]
MCADTALALLDVAVVNVAGLFTAAVVAAAVGAVPARRSGLISGVDNAVRQTRTALGVAVFGTASGPPCDAEGCTATVRQLGRLGAESGPRVRLVRPG